MTATIYEVAKKSGFSIGTVSRVLNGSPLHTKATRAKVLQAINELDYQPFAMARGLARRKTNTIGVVAPSFGGRAHAEMLCGIQRGLAQYNYDLLLYGIDDLQDPSSTLRRALQQRRVDGMLLVSMKPSNVLAANCKRRRLPLVLVDSHHQQFDSTTAGHRESTFLEIGYQAVLSLMALLENSEAPPDRALRPQHVYLKPELVVRKN
ncbi:LacI family transcriptional regulator [candidate division KSB1 bacterium]|nr:LacI family transcriptional regulator [candidate division KSB1 bacterium]